MRLSEKLSYKKSTCLNQVKKRNSILLGEKNGYGKNFNHGTGHGLGLEIHTQPRLSKKSKQVLEVNNVVTVEPGIYLAGWGGVRIEDDIIILEDGCEVLNATTRELVTL